MDNKEASGRSEGSTLTADSALDLAAALEVFKALTSIKEPTPKASKT